MHIANSLRRRLLLLVLFPILVVVPAIMALSLLWAGQFFYKGLLRKVNTDLAVVHDVFERRQHDYLSKLEGLANSYEFRTALDGGDLSRLADQVSTLRDTAGFGFLHLTGPDGHWLLQEPASGEAASQPSPLTERAAVWGIPGVGVEVFDDEYLQREGPSLRERARMALVETPHAASLKRRMEDQGLLLRAVVPVRNRSGGVAAVLDGGILLSRNFALVDAIRDLVYGPGSVPEGAWGAVTVYLGDVRVATNLPLREGERALGTLASDDVRRQVLEQGEPLVARSLVIDDWFISGYSPVEDVNGKRVGMLATGFPEAPYRQAYLQAMTVLLLLLLGTAGLGAVLAVRGARSIFRPVEAMTEIVRATQAGEARRIGDVKSRDELGELAREFDRMLDLLSSRSEELRRAADELEGKVSDRTRELREQNQRLERTVALLHQTRHQLMEAEKLAALGELTAGVAHEINNPTAVILGNVEVLEGELGEHADVVREEIDLIYEQVSRIRSIVGRLLQYSREVRADGELEAVDVNAAINDTLVLVQHEAGERRARIVTNLGEERQVMVRRHELQQVLVNIIVNAIHALAPGGTVRVSTRPRTAGGVVIAVADDGAGILPEHLNRVFDPFFTTKGRDGTGLGLSVSYGLVKAWGGSITVSSRPGAGACFEVHLPAGGGLPGEA